MPDNKCIHMIGMRGNQLDNAIKIWGQPDFIHHVHDLRGHQEIDWDNDIIILGKSCDLKSHSWNDSQHQ